MRRNHNPDIQHEDPNIEVSDDFPVPNPHKLKGAQKLDYVWCLEYVKKNGKKSGKGIAKKMMTLGLKKPDWIDDKHWFGQNARTPDRDPDVKVILYMAAWGMKVSQIIDESGVGKETVKRLLADEENRKKITDIQDRIWGKEPKKWIEKILPQAIATALEIMQDPTVKPGTRLQAATEFMDRAMGKAAQKIEVEDSSMRKVIEKLDEMERMKKRGLQDSDDALEAEYTEVREKPALESPPEKPKDLVDRWIEESYAEEVQLGKKD